MGLRDKLEGGAGRVGGTARDIAATRSVRPIGHGSAGLRSLFAANAGSEVSVERFLSRLVRAVRDDEQADDRSRRDALETARRRRRRLGAVALGAGPLVGVANQVADLYCETATVCDLANVHGLQLSDDEIVARMLVLWSLTDELSVAERAVGRSDGTSVANLLAARLGPRTTTLLPEHLTPRAAVQALWEARGVASDVRSGARHGAVSTVVFAGRHAKRFIRDAEALLGVR